MFFKIGEIVTVRDDLMDGRVYHMDKGGDGAYFVRGRMDYLLGKTVKITAYEYSRYRINNGGGFFFTDEMFVEYMYGTGKWTDPDESWINTDVGDLDSLW